MTVDRANVDLTPLQHAVLRVLHKYATKHRRTPSPGEMHAALPRNLQSFCETRGQLLTVIVDLEHLRAISWTRDHEDPVCFMPKSFELGWLPISIPLLSIEPSDPTSILTTIPAAKVAVVFEGDDANQHGIERGDILFVGEGGRMEYALFIDVPVPDGAVFRPVVDDGVVRMLDHRIPYQPNLAHYLFRWRVLGMLRRVHKQTATGHM